MKISIHWLKEYIQLVETPDKLSEILTKSGLEVSHIASFNSLPGNLKDIIIGQVVACTKHPNADKLYCTQVDIGTEVLPIICGAPNVQIGLKVAAAPIGTTLQTYTGDIIKIKQAKIRGMVSEGMLCAEDELGLSAHHEGILTLNTDLPLGTPLSQYFNEESDSILTVDLTPNRIDACSHIGVARELRALLDRPIQYPAVLENLTLDLEGLPIRVHVQDASACPRYTGIVISDVYVKESPAWLQKKLQAIGVTPINNVVDITNLVMHELGQPMHAFDYDKLTSKEITIRLAQPGEKLLTLDGIDRELTGQELVIANQNNALALAGILGGENSKIDNKTKTIFLESAYFSPSIIREATKYHKIATDASFRFEKGSDPNMPIIALKRACLLLKDLASGKIASELIDIYPTCIESRQVQVDYENIRRLIGQEIPSTTIKKILNNLDIQTIQEDEKGFLAIVPPYRVDVLREVDIIEEILRIYGYDNIQTDAHLQSTYLTTETHPLSYQITSSLTSILVANGYQEICTNSLTPIISDKIEDNGQSRESILLLNPLSDRASLLRNNLSYSGLEIIAYNINRKQTDLKLFEFGKIYYREAGELIEKDKLGIWITGKIETPNWIRPSREVNFQDLNTIIHKLLEKWDITSWEKKIFSSPTYKAGMQILNNNKTIVTVGELAASYLSTLEIKHPVFFAEIDLELLYATFNSNLYYRPISKFPPVKRDLSLVVDQSILFEDIKHVLTRHKDPLIQSMQVFDVYEGKNLPTGKKAYGLSFFLQDKDKTLDENTIQQTMARLIEAVQKELGAIIRE